MKIRNERLEALLPQEFVPKTAQTGGRDFENMLAQQLGQEAGGIGAPRTAVAGLNSLDPMLIADQTVSDDSELLSGIVGQTDDLLGAWDQYAAAIGSGSAGTKSAWAMLAGMDARVQGLRADMGKLGTQDKGLDAVVSELEVLTATEKFKFNRGDYQ